jgi:hypothetical protein
MRTKKLLLIAAIAVMLAAATSAYGYHEVWDGWWSSGWIDYNDHLYTQSGEGGYIRDYTYSATRDTFYFGAAMALIPFVCEEIDDTICLELPLSETYGGKETGTEDTKEGEGEWSGTGYHLEDHELVWIFDILGTWYSTAPNHFNYDSRPDPTYTAESPSTGSNPPGVRARGYSRGYRSYFDPFEPQP